MYFDHIPQPNPSQIPFTSQLLQFDVLKRHLPTYYLGDEVLAIFTYEEHFLLCLSVSFPIHSLIRQQCIVYLACASG